MPFININIKYDSYIKNCKELNNNDINSFIQNQLNGKFLEKTQKLNSDISNNMSIEDVNNIKNNLKIRQDKLLKLKKDI